MKFMNEIKTRKNNCKKQINHMREQIVRRSMFCEVCEASERLEVC